MKPPKGKKGLRAKLCREKQITTVEVKRALTEASKALDSQTQELVALKRILISERAQVIFYSDKYIACLRGECIDLKPQNFLELEESLQERYVKQAVTELANSNAVVPHDSDVANTQEAASSVAKKIILPN